MKLSILSLSDQPGSEAVLVLAQSTGKPVTPNKEPENLALLETLMEGTRSLVAAQATKAKLN